MPETCRVLHCTKPACAKGLCNTHYMRQRRRGTVEQTRPADWGQREKHPAYKAWCGLIRYHRRDMDPTWVADFWAFANGVPPYPTDGAQVFRPDKSKPWSATNFYWRKAPVSAEHRESRATYMREYQRRLREANPDRERNKTLLRHYGVTVQWYDAKLAEQDGKCAVCGQPETKAIKGRVLALAVDHDHETGATRDLLCLSCNRGLGLFRDDPDRLLAAAAYIERHRKPT